MILADTLKTLTSFTAPALTKAIQLAGYKKDSFTAARFLGMTNGLQFCYLCTYTEDGEICTTKVYVSYDPTADRVIVDY